jgi:hypothetical protein
MPASAAQLVRIGAAHFPPYTVRPAGADTGLLPQLVEALNACKPTIIRARAHLDPRRFR